MALISEPNLIELEGSFLDLIWTLYPRPLRTARERPTR
jgi:hypothetical protein